MASQVVPAEQAALPAGNPKDDAKWFMLDPQGQPQGPYPATTVTGPPRPRGLHEAAASAPHRLTGRW